MTTDLDAIERRHTARDRVGKWEGWFMSPQRCLECDRDWPCDASLLLAALSEAEAERDERGKELVIERSIARERLHKVYAEHELRLAAEARLEAVEGAVRQIAEGSVACWCSDRARAALAQEHPKPR